MKNIMKAIFSSLLLVIVLFCQGQNNKKERIFKGTVNNLPNIEHLIDSLLLYPTNIVRMSTRSPMGNDSLEVLKDDYGYSLICAYSSDSLQYNTILPLYKLANNCSIKTTYRHKQLAADLFDAINNKLIRGLYSNQVKQAKKNNDTTFLKHIALVENIRFYKKSDSIIIDLGCKCIKNYLNNCYRYLANQGYFELCPSFVNEEVVELLRYNLKHPDRNAEELRIASENGNRNLFFLQDTLQCASFPKKIICQELANLKKESCKRRISLDSLVQFYNSQKLKEIKLDVERENLCLHTLYYLLDKNPIKDLASDIESCGLQYRSYSLNRNTIANKNNLLNFEYLLARINYKDYRNKYVLSIDSIITEIGKQYNAYLQFNSYKILLENLVEIGSDDGVFRLARLLKNNTVIFDEMYEEKTTIGIQMFKEFRKVIPSLNDYGRTIFNAHCVKINTIGITDENKVSLSKANKENCARCTQIYDSSEPYLEKYYPSNFCKLMYDWMVKNKGQYKIDSNRNYDPY